MKIIVIGDVHGLDTWKEVVKQEADTYVFLGDYFDSFNHTAQEQIDNFNEIIKFKKDSDKEVVLLIGNHDMHYLIPQQQCSGFQSKHAKDIRHALLYPIADLKYAYLDESKKYLFTHAGVTKTWAEEYNINLDNVAESINRLPGAAFSFKFTGFRDLTGNHPKNGPLWVRPEALIPDAFTMYTQIVGHTMMEEPLVYPHVLYVMDTLHNGIYLEITEEGPNIKHI